MERANRRIRGRVHRNNRNHAPHVEDLPPQNPDLLKNEVDPMDFFERTSPLGVGSFGTVYMCKRIGTEQSYALKTVKLDAANLEENPLKEIYFLDYCSGPWVCGFSEAYAFDKKVTIVLEVFDCGSVHDLISMAKVDFDEITISHILCQVLLGMEFLQTKRVLHRDIKAGNLLLSQFGETKLCDFGVSKYLPNTDRTTTVIGTPFWMAPEISTQTDEDGGYTFNSDCWSLGITAIEMKEHELPYKNSMKPIHLFLLHTTRDPPTLKRPQEVSPLFNEFLSLCLMKVENGKERPFANELLEHELICNIKQELLSADIMGSSKLVAEVVKQNLSKVLEFRKNTPFYDGEKAEGRTVIADDGGLSDDSGPLLIHGGPGKEAAFNNHVGNGIVEETEDDLLSTEDNTFGNSSRGGFNSLVIRNSVIGKNLFGSSKDLRNSVRAQSFARLVKAHSKKPSGFFSPPPAAVNGNDTELRTQVDTLESGIVLAFSDEEKSVAEDTQGFRLTKMKETEAQKEKRKLFYEKYVKPYTQQATRTFSQVNKALRRSWTRDNSEKET
eukprot:maker-scaffold_1-snap-gene-32.50-mRNA-1 protein AED:0.02 eAED:0.02 QI:195/1/1/1/0.66/0.5/4/156/553